MWQKAVASQTNLTALIAQLQEEMRGIKDFSALPVFRGGMALLELSMRKTVNCMKRLGTVGNRLKRIEATLQAQRLQKQKQLGLQKAAAAKAAPPPKKPEPVTEKAEAKAAPPPEQEALPPADAPVEAPLEQEALPPVEAAPAEAAGEAAPAEPQPAEVPAAAE
jgi:hypothetical protein